MRSSLESENQIKLSHEKLGRIKVKSINRTYNVSSSCTAKISIDLTMFIPTETRFFIFPIRERYNSLQVKFDGAQELSVLSHLDIEDILEQYEESGQSIDISFLRENGYFERKILLRLLQEISADILDVPFEDICDHENFVIVELPHCGGHHTINISWIYPLETFWRHGMLTTKIEFSRDFEVGKTTYVDLKVDERFAILTSPSIRYRECQNDYSRKQSWKILNIKNLKEDEKDYEQRLTDSGQNVRGYCSLFGKRHYAFRFEPLIVRNKTRIQFCMLIGVPSQVRLWMGTGLTLGSLHFIFLLFNQENLQVSAVLTVGVITGIIGLSLVLVHDTELLKRWHYPYIVLIVLIFLTTLIKLKSI